jgi:hypothetical protein
MSNNQVRCFGRRETDVDFAIVGRLPGRVAELSVDEDLACARTTNNDVHCWAIDAFRADFGALEAGIARCWAGDRDGFLCEEALTNRAARAATRIRRVARRVSSVSVNDYTLCTTDAVTGELLCSQADQPEPRSTRDPSWNTTCTGRAVQVAAGTSHSCAATSDGHVYCWGELNDSVFDSVPDCVGGLAARRLRGIDDAASVHVGFHDVCVVHHDRTLTCHPARLLSAAETRVVQLDGLGPVRSVSMRHNAGCAQTDDLQVHCWGDNTNAHLGVGDMLEHFQPVSVPRLAASTSFATSYGLSCGVVQGSLRCAGELPFGWVEDPDANRFVPLRDAQGSQVTAIDIAANGHSVCARLPDRTWVCTDLDASTASIALMPWADGRTDVAYVGARSSLTEDGTFISHGRTMPDVVSVAGTTLPCALRRDGQVYCFDSYLPHLNLRARRLARDEPVVEVRADDVYVCTRAASGTVQCNARPAGRDVTPPAPQGAPLTAFAGGDPATLCAVTDGGAQRCVNDQDHDLLRSLETRLPAGPPRDILDRHVCLLDAANTLTCSTGSPSLTTLPNVAQFRLGPHFVVARDGAGQVWVLASRASAGHAHAGRHASLTPVHVDIPTTPSPRGQPRVRAASLNP